MPECPLQEFVPPRCHLELELHSNQFGFSVFTEQMNLAEAPGCGRDFYQFGRFDMEKSGPEKDISLKIFLKKDSR